MRAFVEGSEPAHFQITDRTSAYVFVRRTLVRFEYHGLWKPDKGLVKRFLDSSDTTAGQATSATTTPYGAPSSAGRCQALMHGRNPDMPRDRVRGLLLSFSPRHFLRPSQQTLFCPDHEEKKRGNGQQAEDCPSPLRPLHAILQEPKDSGHKSHDDGAEKKHSRHHLKYENHDLK